MGAIISGVAGAVVGGIVSPLLIGGSIQQGGAVVRQMGLSFTQRMAVTGVGITVGTAAVLSSLGSSPFLIGAKLSAIAWNTFVTGAAGMLWALPEELQGVGGINLDDQTPELRRGIQVGLATSMASGLMAAVGSPVAGCLLGAFSSFALCGMHTMRNPVVIAENDASNVPQCTYWESDDVVSAGNRLITYIKEHPLVEFIAREVFEGE